MQALLLSTGTSNALTTYLGRYLGDWPLLSSTTILHSYATSRRSTPHAVNSMSSAENSRKRKRDTPHPYLTGNFAPIHQTLPLTPCTYTGTIPEEFYGGEYVRNGGNPVTNEDLGRDAHWFDGDGMLSGVAFTRTEKGVRPQFVNQYILTDVYLSSITSPFLLSPILPSIATLVNPLSTLYYIVWRVFRTIFLVILSYLPGSQQVLKKISVANTGFVFHDGRGLATCESGPPMRIALPGLETVGWYNGKKADGEKGGEEGAGFGGEGFVGFMKEWTTAHPRVDPKTGELILFHSTFLPPYIHYSIVPATYSPTVPSAPLERPTRLLNAPVPGVSAARMMHDFGVSFDHTVIMDLPLSLDPTNLAVGKPAVAYDSAGKSRFGVFPRHQPELIRWFETNACCIFHTANTWDDKTFNKLMGRYETTAVNMLACRLTSASLVFSAGGIAAPQPIHPITNQEEDDQCRLYYYKFSMQDAGGQNTINHQFSLSALSFEFPSTNEALTMAATKYIYGCTTTSGSFGAALGRSVQIDCLVKFDVETLIKRGIKDESLQPVVGCVDERSISEVLASSDPEDPIKIFKFPYNYCAQEPRFVSRKSPTREDDGWLVTYVFDESQLDEMGECKPDAKSELWIIDALDMKTVVAKVSLPQRVPYGLHGSFIGGEKVDNQRPIETIRSLPSPSKQQTHGLWLQVRKQLEYILG